MIDRSADDLERDPLEESKPIRKGVLPARARTNDPRAQREKAIDDRQRTLRIENDYLAVLALPAGQRLIAHIMNDLCAHDAPYFNPSNSVMCNVAGRRQVGWLIEQEVRNISFELWTGVDAELEALRVKPPGKSSD